MSAPLDLRIFPDRPALFQAAADEFVRQARAAIQSSGRFTVALAGGSTPKGLYSLLATHTAIPWDKVRFFFGDERHVPPDDPESNYRMARETLLSKVPIPSGDVYRVPAENPDAGQAAQSYEHTLRQFFQTPPTTFPRFDLILLGMGPDGHTASLFPGGKALQERSRWVVADWVEKFKTDRITLTLPVLNNAAVVMFLVSGEDKAETLKEVLEGTQPADLFPSKLVRPTDGKLIWLADQAAAAGFSRRPS
ncbi:MAG: 6-phosphogluconolactonase [Terriglobales bacterium]